MSKGTTEIVYILDRSGSIGGLEADTIGCFNAMKAHSADDMEDSLNVSGWENAINADYNNRGN